MNGTFTLAAVGILFQGAGAPVQQPAQTPITGFVYCSGPDQTSAPVFLDPCNKLRIGGLKCGEEVQVIERETGYFKVAPADKLERYMTEESVSQSKEKLVPLVDVPTSNDSSCKFIKTPKRQAPAAIYSPDPDYSDEARRKGLQGTIVLSLVVAPNGVPTEIRIIKSLGMGLDQEAVKALKKWRFKPGMEDGKPVAVPITVNIDFHTVTTFRR
jgi:TonB family protein